MRAAIHNLLNMYRTGASNLSTILYEHKNLKHSVRKIKKKIPNLKDETDKFILIVNIEVENSTNEIRCGMDTTSHLLSLYMRDAKWKDDINILSNEEILEKHYKHNYIDIFDGCI